MSHKIKYVLEEHDFIILIGDTPSYLSFFFNNKKYFILPMSNKAFGTFVPPYGEFDDDCVSKILLNPTKKDLLSYFDYLDKNTILTRKFVKEKWNNIILIDTV